MPYEIANDAASAPELRRRLDEVERRFRSFLATAADWCWEADAEGRPTWLSRESILPPDLLVGRTRWEAAGVDPQADPAWRVHVSGLRAGRAFRGFRYTLRRPDGGLLHCSINGDPLFDAGGVLVGWRGTGRDVTAEVEAAAEIAEGGPRRWIAEEGSPSGSLAGPVPRTLEAADRLNAERTLRESLAELERKQAELAASERRFRDLIEGSLQGVLIVQGRRFVYVNQALCRMSGYAAEELLAADRWLIVAPEDLPRFKRSLAARPAGRADFKGLRKDGRRLWLECLIRPVEWADGPAWQVVAMDATDRRRAEEQLRRAQRMEAVGQLTGGVAHDFNNLLAIILGNLDVVREADLLPPAETRMLESVVAAAARGARLTGSLLAFARRQQLDPETCDVNALVERSAELLDRTLGETIAVELRLAAGLPTVQVDPEQLQAALLNLALNARDAMPEGGRIAIETAAAAFGPEQGAEAGEIEPGDYVTLSVADSGAGMPPEVRERAFEPFFTTKEVGKGAGLGLSMVYGFVEQSGGRVRVRSESGAGSVFTLYFPRTADRDPAGTDPAPGEAAGLRVLMVEDDPEVRQTVLAMLASIGCPARAEPDGASALQALAGGEPFDVLLTDVVLPGKLRGVEIAEHARRLRPDIKVLFMTGYAPQTMLTSADLADGAPLGKPFRRTDLSQALARLRRL